MFIWMLEKGIVIGWIVDGWLDDMVICWNWGERSFEFDDGFELKWGFLWRDGIMEMVESLSDMWFFLFWFKEWEGKIIMIIYNENSIYFDLK